MKESTNSLTLNCFGLNLLTVLLRLGVALLRADALLERTFSMANVNLISFTLEDENANRGNVVIPCPTGFTLAEYQAYATALAPDLDGVTGAKIVSANLALALTLPAGLKAAPVGDHFIQTGANMGYDAAATPYRHTIRVPAFMLSKLVGEDVDAADADVVTFNLELTVGNGTIQACDKYGNDLSSFIGGLLTFRKR